jgi:membrane-associated protease RseP (regulator of RpoE activity)
MCLHRFLAAVAAVALASNLASAQTLLDRVESSLQKKPATAAPPLTAPGAAAEAPSPYLGFVPNETIDDGKGVHIDAVTKGGPAELGGLKAGDLITAIDGKAVKNLNDFDAIYATTTVGQKLRMTVERDKKVQSLTVTLGTRPAAAAAVGDEPGEPALALPDPSATTPKPTLDPLPAPADPPTATTPSPAPIRSSPLEAKPLDLGAPPAANPDPLAAPGTTPLPPEPSPPAAVGGRPSLGITVLDLTPEARAAYGLTVRGGALITNIRAGSPADTAGLPIGGVVVALDGRRIDTADDLVSAIRARQVGSEVELTYYQGTELARKNVRLAPAGEAIVGSPPVRGGLDLGIGGPDRPLLNRVEDLVEGQASPRTAPGSALRGPSTVYDPSEMAALRDQVLSLEEQVTALTERIKLLEGKLGGAAPAENPAP